MEPVKVPGHPGLVRSVIIIVVIVTALLVVALYVRGMGNNTTTTIMTTTAPSIKMAQITSCGKIDSSGNYYLNGPVSTGIQEGVCINVTSSNVSIVCNGNGLYGSGPYVIVPPFTYGILVGNAANVSISGCIIRNFSYGVYASLSSRVSITSSNVSRNYVSNVWLQNTSDSVISHDTLFYNPSEFGSLHINGSSTNNTVSDNHMQYNSKLGVFINSSGNRFINNTVMNNPVSFRCVGVSGFRHNNTALQNSCSNSTGCSFVSCSGANIQPDLSNITLSSKINSCGTIRDPGTYTLQRDLDMRYYLNTTGTSQPCIGITSGNAVLECDGRTIYNATAGIGISAGNVSVTNCNVRDSNTGISIGAASGIHLSNIMVVNNSAFGISLTGSTDVHMDNVTATRNGYGISLSSSVYTLVNRFSVLNNTFGLYLDGSNVNTFENGAAINNTKADVYATGGTANDTSSNLFQKSSCTVGDAAWANCKLHIAPSLEYYPVQSCGALTRPGTYLLSSNLVGLTSTCFNVMQNGTILNCDGHSLISPTHSGAAVSVKGKTNVLVENCTIQGFHTGVSAIDSQVFVNEVSILGSVVGVNLTRSMASAIINNTISGTSNYSIYMANVISSVVQDNRINGGVSNNVGIYVANSTGNHVLNNSMVGTVTGLYLDGKSDNNTVSNNSGSQNVQDYVCSAANSRMGSELGGINFGTKKLGCTWMAATLPQSLPQSQLPCTTASKPTSFSLTNDYVYGSGATCFTVKANDTAINCNGHTIIAKNGGTFADFEGVGGKPLVENCNLIGFTGAITSRNSSVQVLNNTIYDAGAETQGSTAINVTGSGSMLVSRNKVSGVDRGIVISKVTLGTVSYNNVSATYPYVFDNVSGVAVQYDLAQNGIVAMSLINSTKNSFNNNQLYGTTGLLCKGTSMHSASNADQGANLCSNSNGCSAWLGSSLATCGT